MDLSPAPFFDDVAGGPPGGAAHWAQTADGLRIRVGHWRPEGDAQGTVLLFPGRTEYIEKYGDAAAHLAARGFATLAVDWRGQGLADRLIADGRLGHVGDFPDYQHDVNAVVAAARHLGLPEPFHLLAHSMGGCIGLRAVMDGVPVASCAFSGPMWGIYVSPVIRPFAMATVHGGRMFGLGRRIMPSTTYESYVTVQPFEDNTLTTDPDMYRMMRDQLAAHPELGLGGPTLHWMGEAVAECDLLAARTAPDLPCVTFMGTNERIVDRARIRERMAGWPGGQLFEIPGAEHEVLMEGTATRAGIFDRMCDFYRTSGAA